MKYVLANTLPILCVLIAAYLIILGKNHWGWFILIAILAGHTFGDETEQKGTKRPRSFNKQLIENLMGKGCK